MTPSGLNKARLGRMHDVLARYVESGRVPGIVAAVSRRGETHVDVLGKMSRNGADPMRRDTIFRISSMTKPVTAVATMVLVEQGELRLDDPVDGLLPELSNRRVLKRPDGPLDDTVPADRAVTVRDLLTFCMGFGIIMAPPGTYPIQKALDSLGLGQGMPAPLTPPAPDEWMKRFGTLPLIHQPGAQWMYNTGADILGVLIARASGQSLEAFLRDRIFGPLGMKDTSFSVPASEIDRLAASYITDPNSRKPVLYDAAREGQWSRSPDFPSGAAGLVSTIVDFMAFGQMMQGKGRVGSSRVISRPSVELMTTDQLTPEQKEASGLRSGPFKLDGWGLCMATVTRRDNVFFSPGSYGWNGGMGTTWWSDPAVDMVTILMTQQAMTSPAQPDLFVDFWTSAYAAVDD